MCKIGRTNGVAFGRHVLSFNEEEKKDTTIRFIEHYGVQQYLPNYVKHGKDAKNNHKLVGAIKTIYNQLVATRHNQHLTYKNVLLSAIVSANGRRSQNHIAKTIGAHRYSIQKAVVRCIHVHYTGENIWGGLPRKCQRDVMNDEDWELIVKWWETSMIVSPNQKDVKRQRIIPKTFEQHVTHYLQESQVQF